MNDEVRAAAERLIGEVANHRVVMRYAYDPDMRFVDDIETVARAALEAGQEVDKAQTLAASLSKELHRVGKEVGRLRGFIRGVIDKDVPEGDEAVYLNAIKWAAPFALRRAGLSTPSEPENRPTSTSSVRRRADQRLSNLVLEGGRQKRYEVTCDCCLDAARFPGSGEPPCPSCGHTVEDCNKED